MKSPRKPAAIPRKLDFETPSKKRRITATVAAAATTNVSRIGDHNDDDDGDEKVEQVVPLTPGTTTTLTETSRHIVTPSDTKQPQQHKAARRRLAFGKSEAIDICDNVRLTHKLIRKTTGSIGGNGSFGAIYGELTMGSMQKMVNLMKAHTEFGPSSRFIDVGSGIGKPNLHVIHDPGVEFSYGIEMERSRWMLGLASLNAVLQEACRADSTLGYKCMFDHGNIKAAKAFDPFTHVYMFSIGFPPTLWEHLAAMFNASQSLYLICFHSPRVIVEKYGFEVELITQTSTSMHGSSEGHSGYLYKRIGVVGETSNDTIPLCDALYRDAYELVKSGKEQLCEVVAQKVDKELCGGRVTRAKKVVHCVLSDNDDDDDEEEVEDN